MKNIKGDKLQSELLLKEMRINKDEESQMIIKRQYDKTISQLIADYMLERNAKNKAYSFILTNNLYDKFVDYCKKNK